MWWWKTEERSFEYIPDRSERVTASFWIWAEFGASMLVPDANGRLDDDGAGIWRSKHVWSTAAIWARLLEEMQTG